MDFTPGTDARITATTLENQFFSIALTIQEIERNISFNPDDDINIITASLDTDTGIFSGSCDVYVIATSQSDGTHIITYPNPYTAYTLWTEGTGGQGLALNINHAIAQRGIWLARYERDSVFNVADVDNKITGISWSLLDEPTSVPVTHNAKLTFDFSLELEVVSSNNGTVHRAKPWLTGTFPVV